MDTTGSTDPDVLEDYLHNKAKGVPGVTGPIGFTAQGDREGVPYLMYGVDDNGKYVIYKSKKK